MPSRRSKRRSPRKKSRRSRSPRSKKISPALLKRYKSPRKSSRSPKAKSVFNRFFDKIFIINLKDATKRLKTVSKQYRKKGIKFDVYEGIDGRCKEVSECNKKQKSFEKTYGVKYGKRIKNPKERLPASSLTLAHKLIYTEMLEQGWDRILISEDDVWFHKDSEKRFKKAIEELPDDWDMLYLGAGGDAGLKGISMRKTKVNKYLSDLTPHYGYKWYVSVKEDLRSPCDECEPFSSQLSMPSHPGGAWGVAVSKKGAKKILKIIGETIKDHNDKIYPKAIYEGKLKAYALDPPILYHEGGAFRPDSSIPWTW